MNEGYIKISRSMAKWEWYKDMNTKAVFLHLLIMANWKDGRYRGDVIPRGSLVTGRKKLAEELGISEQSVRTSLNQLKSTNEITIKSSLKYSVITINNYEKYQGINQVPNQQLTNNQPTTNHNRRNKECKEGKNISYSAEAEGADPSWPQPLDDAVHKWMQYRREIGRPLKNTSFDQLYKQIEKRLPEIGADRISEIIYFSISQGYQGIAWTALDERRPSKVYRESPATEKKRDAFFEEFQNKIITDRRKP